MSQASSAPVSSFQSQIYEQPSINGCRWAWCRLFFPTHADLVHHVIYEHVRNAVPVMRKDLTMIRRAEEGSGESLSLSIFGLSYPQHIEPSSSKGEQDVDRSLPEGPPSHTIPPDVQPSSLPSPPASSPTSIPPLSPVQILDRAPPALNLPQPNSDSDMSEEDQFSPTSARRPTSNLSRHPSSSPVTPLPHQTRPMESTPSFAVLSSPADSPPIPPVPPTPSFNSQVESVIGKRKRDDKAPSKTPPRRKLSLRNSFDSHSSSCSQDSVEKHLTQSMEICDDDLNSQVDPNTKNTRISIIEGTHAGELQSKEKSKIGVFQRKPSQLRMMGTLLQSTPLPHQLQSKQAWYGTRLPTTPAVKQKKGTPSTNSRAPSGMSPSSVLNLSHPKTPPRRLHSTTLNTYRSGILEIAPSVAVAANSRVQEEQRVSDSQTFSQSQEFESSVEYLSYPLQTQAPYQSQSFSQ